MNRKEALEHFENTIAKSKVDEILVQFYEDFKNQKEEFCKKLFHGVRTLLEQMNETEKEVELAVIHINYLQAHIIDGTYQWRIAAYDQTEYLDKTEREIYVAFPEIFQCLQKLEDELQKEVRKYVGNLNEGDIIPYKLQAFEKCLGCIYLAATYTFHQLRQEEFYKIRKKFNIFRILLGGYMEQMQLVFLQTNEDYEKAKEEWYLPGEKKTLDEQKFVYRDYSQIEMREVSKRVEAKNLMFTCFAQSQIYYHIFTFCSMIGVNFSESQIESSAFVAATMQQADFTKATISNCDMHTSMFYGGEYVDGEVTPGIFPVSFRNATLDRVNFMFCDLRNCDFEGAVMKEIVFDGAKLSGARINSCYRDQLDFTKEQMQEIIWIE